MPKFSINTEFIQFEIELCDKYILILGDSEKGKSFFISEVNRIIDSGYDYIKSDLPYHVILNRDGLKLIDSYINEELPHIFIADEFIAHDVIGAIQGKNAYCIVVTRKIYKDINMSYRCLYKMCRNQEGISTIERFVEIPEFKIGDEIEAVITEDAEAGYNYIKALCKAECNVVSAKGKSNLKIAIDNIDCKSLLVFADGGGLASDIQAVMRSVRGRARKGKNTWLCLPECFEQILLCSEFLGKDKDIFRYYLLKFNNTESFCEDLVYRLTEGKPYEYSHQRQVLSPCWVINCEECESCIECAYKVDGNKNKSVLVNGPCPELLTLSKSTKITAVDVINQLQKLIE